MQIRLAILIASFFAPLLHLGAATIDKISVANIFGYEDLFYPSTGLNAAGFPQTYFLSDGTLWRSGAGVSHSGEVGVTSISVSGAVISYDLQPLNGSSVAAKFTDYSFGDHSAQGEFDFATPLTLIADVNSNVATLSGYLKLVSNDATLYGEPRFNYFSASVGALVPFKVTYTLQSGQWDLSTFDTNFIYSATGEIDLASAVPEPSTSPIVVFGALAFFRCAPRKKIF